MVQVDRQILTRLRWRWLYVALLYALTLLLGYRFLAVAWAPEPAIQWLSLATAMMVIQMGILWWALQHNHRMAESSLLPFLGYGNGMTLTRGLVACLLAGFLFAPYPPGALAWAPAVLYTLDRLIDYVDGYVARITWTETKLGAILDMEFDGLGIAIAILLAIHYGHLPVWYLVLAFSRQLFVAGMWWRQRQGQPVYDLPPSDYRRLVAGFQTGFITVTLWPALSAPALLLAAYLFALPLIYSFGRDWLVVSAVLDPASTAYQMGRQTLKRVLGEWLPVGARVVATIITIFLLWRAGPTLQPWLAHLTAQGASGLATLLPLLTVLWALAAGAVLLGVVGRLAALALIGLAFLEIGVTGLHLVSGLLLVSAIIVLHLGSGRFALWQPEEWLIRVKLGAPPPPAA